MLNQAIHWLEIVGTAVDAILLCRVLLLKLHRVYLFITLACVLAVFFDVVIDLWLHDSSVEGVRVFLYSRFLYAFVYPAVAWDVFEELKPQIAKVRRIAIGRLISGLFFAVIFGLLASLFVQGTEGAEPAFVTTLALVLWAGSSAATLAFLWTLHRVLRSAKVERPNNTSVWLIFWELSLLAEIANCFSGLTLQVFRNQLAEDILNVVFLLYGIGITAWCILKLRGLPPDVSSAPANANL